MNDLKILERYESKFLDSNWDNKVLNYDKKKYDWSTLFLESIREKFPTLDQLDNLHLYVKTNQLVDLRKHLERMSLGEQFQSLADNFFKEYITPLLPVQDYMIQKTPGIRLLVPDQAKKGRLLSFHTGHWTGYNNGMYTVWTPVTKTWDTNAMQVVNWNDSITAMKEIHSKKLSTIEVEELCKKICWPTNLNVGQSWLFNQGHLHGNVNNDTGVSRVSFDLRAMIKGSDYGFRYPGGFWRLHSETTYYQIPKQLDRNKRWITLSDQGSKYVGSTPQYIIREFLLSWCSKNNIVPIEWTNEYLHCEWSMNLQYVIDNGAIDGIILPSIYAITAEPSLRLKIMETAIERNIQMVFVDEDILLDSKESLEYIKRIYKYAYEDINE